MIVLSFRMPGERGRRTLVVDVQLKRIAKRHLKRLGAKKIRVSE